MNKYDFTLYPVLFEIVLKTWRVGGNLVYLCISIEDMEYELS